MMDGVKALKHIVGWAGVVVFSLAVIGMGLYLSDVGLDRADKLGSSIGAIVSLVGLGVSIYAVIRVGGRSPQSGGQSVTGSTIGDGILQVRGVRRSVRVGRSANGSGPTQSLLPAALRPSSSNAGPEPGEQSVTGTQTSGAVQQFDDIGGDLDIDR
ncbi:hypothetical protein EV645_6599 [Kribbella rubisoli]|uniref:Uncharacterized protein n=1 Tax=Kribbella rubisoli TaxID=3075929 RepID=A0A4Q7WQE8_9ACTN|nr:hypothetical protein [Kribbella rubisoli]RZU11429.1 hypothetical protein EV645_6599 [Kribbella rubisoli]